MIDLTQDLPNAIMGDNGESIFLNTDYRLWIKFYKDIENNELQNSNISYLFKNEIPIITDNVLRQLLAFLYNPSVTPKNESSSDKVMDYILDGDYIFSALYQTYGIDIIEMEMHWHKFQALCNNIVGESTLWGYAKSVRGYEKPNKKDTIDSQYLKAKSAWSFPTQFTEEEIRQIQEFEDYFDGR